MAATDVDREAKRFRKAFMRMEDDLEKAAFGLFGALKAREKIADTLDAYLAAGMDVHYAEGMREMSCAMVDAMGSTVGVCRSATGAKMADFGVARMGVEYGEKVATKGTAGMRNSMRLNADAMCSRPGVDPFDRLSKDSCSHLGCDMGTVKLAVSQFGYTQPGDDGGLRDYLGAIANSATPDPAAMRYMGTIMGNWLDPDGPAYRAEMSDADVMFCRGVCDKWSSLAMRMATWSHSDVSDWKYGPDPVPDGCARRFAADYAGLEALGKSNDPHGVAFLSSGEATASMPPVVRGKLETMVDKVIAADEPPAMDMAPAGGFDGKWGVDATEASVPDGVPEEVYTATDIVQDGKALLLDGMEPERKDAIMKLASAYLTGVAAVSHGQGPDMEVTQDDAAMAREAIGELGF